MRDCDPVANSTLDGQLSQQTALARFGEFALKSDNLDAILHEACRLVGGALGTQVAKVMEVQPGSQTMLVRSGVGWPPGVVGHRTTDFGTRTAEHLALQTGEPVISPDIKAESRFEYPDFVKANGVQALATVLIVGAGERPAYGVLQVDSRTPRPFTDDDVQFLRSYANLVASAVERLRVEQELRTRAEEKERLLRELQHRVKNNLQTVMNLVQLRVRRARTSEATEALRAVGDGIEALRLVHDKVYQAENDTDRTCLGIYLAELAARLLHFHGKEVLAKVKLVTEVERQDVPLDFAIPLGLVTSEFITNSLKYAFGDRRGVIGLRVEESEPGLLRIALWDNGKGLPASRSGGTGLRLIEGLLRQVGAASEWDGTGGTKLAITARLPLEARP